MKIKTEEIPGNKIQEIEISEGSTYEDVLLNLEINPETVLLLNNGQAVPLDGTVAPGSIKILHVALGG
ncbi:sulfur carrier protein [Methanohalophilus levihalophilus]|uniref:MoaD/ThiS family protein n=1 Tax=Methanohalophilus levihalophilus TaxID=1431282 RepID=UPI001AE6029F|nr:MoaD/ThiS family protein [Methanohalophilus levihalophilus]MBP2029435.1 sulfur carrier protein [Methanohalophilus levihalophilus]